MQRLHVCIALTFWACVHACECTCECILRLGPANKQERHNNNDRHKHMGQPTTRHRVCGLPWVCGVKPPPSPAGSQAD